MYFKKVMQINNGYSKMFISKISVSLEVSFGNFWCAHNGGNFFCTRGDLQKFWAKNVPNSFLVCDFNLYCFRLIETGLMAKVSPACSKNGIFPSTFGNFFYFYICKVDKNLSGVERLYPVEKRQCLYIKS